MDATELTQLVTDARNAQFPGEQTTEQFPSVFFNYDVNSIAPNGQKTSRAPRYCATNYGAARISDVLTASGRGMACSVFLAPAIPMAGAFIDDQPVPWCQFQKDGDPDFGPFTGVKINAGLLLDYFNHGYPPNRALNSCQLEWSDAMAAAGLMLELSQDQRNAIMAQL